MPKCRKCGAPLESGQKFCTECGERVEPGDLKTLDSDASTLPDQEIVPDEHADVEFEGGNPKSEADEDELREQSQDSLTCPYCGSVMPESQAFCTNCGHKLANSSSSNDELEGSKDPDEKAAKATSVASEAPVQTVNSEEDDGATQGTGPSSPENLTVEGEPANMPVSESRSVRDMECPQCGAPLTEGQTFCSECGRRVERESSDSSVNDQTVNSSAGDSNEPSGQSTCPKCGAPIQEGSSFCVECGNPIHEQSDDSAPFIPPESVPKRSSNGFLIGGVIAACVIVGVVLIALFSLGSGGNPQDIYMTEEGYPDIPNILESSFNDKWYDPDSDSPLFAEDMGFEDRDGSGEDNKWFGKPKSSFMGFDEYEVNFVDLPGNVENFIFTYELPWSEADLDPAGVTISGYDLYQRSNVAADKEGKSLGSMLSRPSVRDLNNGYLFCEGVPRITDFDSDDAFELLGLMGIERDDVTVDSERYQRMSLEGAYMACIMGRDGVEGLSTTNGWGYSFYLHGTMQVGDQTEYVTVEARDTATLEPVYGAGNDTFSTQTLHPEIGVTFSAMNLDELLYPSGPISETDTDLIQTSSKPFSATPEFNYGLVEPNTDASSTGTTNQSNGLDGVYADGVDPSYDSDGTETESGVVTYDDGSTKIMVDGDWLWVPNNNGCIIPDSDQRLITSDDLTGLSARELWIARNEIYARHGTEFKTPDLQRWFSHMYWYQPTASPSGLSDIEKENVDYIQWWEAKSYSPYAVGN